MALCISVPLPFEVGDRHTVNVNGALTTVERVDQKTVRIGKSDERKILAADAVEPQPGFPHGGIFLVCNSLGIPDPTILVQGDDGKAHEVVDEERP